MNADVDAAVRRTTAEYCQTCDDGRWDEFALCFAPDAVVQVMGKDIVGRDAIRDWISAAMPPEKRGKHIAVNSLIEVDGDDIRASTDFMFLALGASGPTITTVGRYVDRFVHLDGRWVFASREIVMPPRR